MNQFKDKFKIINKLNRKTSIRILFGEFCTNTSIHGAQYFADRKTGKKGSIIGRTFWFIIFLIILYICGSLIHTVWIKWNKTPVIVTFSDRSTSVWKVPFPTITICPDTKANKTKFNYGKEIEKIYNSENSSHDKERSNERLMLFDAMAQVCDFKFSKHFEFGFNYVNDSFKNILKNVAPHLEPLALEWKGQDAGETWENFLDLILTERGICYSFNFLNASDVYRDDVLYEDTIIRQIGNRKTKWTLENGFKNEAKHDKFPHRTSNAYIKYGLIGIFTSDVNDLDKTCNEGDEGFKVSIDTPGDIPLLSKSYFSIPFSQEVLIDITPEIIEAADNTKEYSPEIRQCYFSSERPLRYFKTYSQANCEFECLANYTLSECGCVRFNMPRVKGTLICAEDKVPCYQNAKRQMMEDNFHLEQLHTDMNVSILADCYCLPSCKSLTYSVGITQGKLGSRTQNILENFLDVKATVFKIYFKDARFWSKQRSKFYGFIDFVAHAGGLLGLFMGVSAISFVEILYFIIMRIWGNKRISRMEKIYSTSDKNV